MSAPSSSRTNPGNFFEDFRLGQQIRHATPRTITVGDVALYNGLFGASLCRAIVRPFCKISRLPAVSDRRSAGVSCCFRQDRARISLNAVANLGYADCRFLKPVYPGVTLNAVSEVIGLGKTQTRRPESSTCARAVSTKAGNRHRLCTVGNGAKARPCDARATRKGA